MADPLGERLLVVGDLCPDIIVTGVPTCGPSLRFGQAEDLVHSTTLTLGGSAAITAAAAATTGLPVRLLAVVGDDRTGSICLDMLRDRGVDTTGVRLDHAAPTGSSVILVRREDPSDRQILTDLGAIQNLTADQVDTAALHWATHLHVSSFFLHTSAREGLHTRMAEARDLGLTVSLDTNDDPSRAWGSGAREAIRQTDVLFANDTELLGLAGVPAADPGEAARLLLNQMPQDQADERFPAVVHKHGPLGASVVTHVGTVHVTAPRVDVVDTVGAGDTLAGTCLAALRRGLHWPESLAEAVAAGSLSTRSAGGVEGHRSLDEVRHLATTLVTTTHPDALEGSP